MIAAYWIITCGVLMLVIAFAIAEDPEYHPLHWLAGGMVLIVAGLVRMCLVNP